MSNMRHRVNITNLAMPTIAWTAATSSKRGLRRLALCFTAMFGLLVALGGCQIGEARGRTTRVDFFTQRAEAFLQALGESDRVMNSSDAIWLLELNAETDTGRAWVGEVRDEVLHVTSMECAFNPCMLRVTAEGRYAHFTTPRKNALVRAFATPTEFVSGRDYPASARQSFSGHGRDFVATVTPKSYLEIEELARRVSDTVVAEPDTHEDVIVPMELAIPWVISRYYATGR
jgi:hypothetical protein